jgi:hypothetical protein
MITKSINGIENYIFSQNDATNIILVYCNRKHKSIPLSFHTEGLLYARTQDVINLGVKPETFVSSRSIHKDLYIKLGSLHIKDDSLRSKITSDARLTVSWLHNPTSVVAILSLHSKDFRDFAGYETKYTYKTLNNLVDNHIQVR